MHVFLIVLPFISILVGLYFITLGLWELREGVNRKQYIKLMFTGLFLLVIITPMMWMLGSSLLLHIR